MTDNRPTIGHILHRLQVAGAEVLAADLARKLSTRFRFVFFCLDAVGPLGERLQGEGFDVLDLGRKPGRDLAVARRLREAARVQRIDLYHAHQYTPFFYAALSRRFSRRPKLLFTEHGRHYPDQRSGKRVFVNRFLLSRDPKWDRVTAVGEFIREALVKNEGLAASRIEVVHNGIDPRKFSLSGEGTTLEPSPFLGRGPGEGLSSLPSGDSHTTEEKTLARPLPKKGEEVKEEVRRSLNLTTEPTLLQVARFHPVKDHVTALRAMADVVKQIPNAVLLLAGDGDLRGELENLAASLDIQNNVRFLGVRSDVPRLMAAADVFLLSSLSEGISVTLLEAMGCELPIAATAVGGNPEVVADGETGLLSPRGEPRKMAENIVTLLRDAALRRRMGAAGRARLLQKFTEDRMHQRYAEIYDEMLHE